MNDKLETAVEKAMLGTSALLPPSIIPPMTDPMGKHWEQPSASDIEIDDKYAMMTKEIFEQLKDYSCTMPTGVYPGKMWKRRMNYHDESKGWLLVWYGHCDKPNHCSKNFREIIKI